MKRFYRYGAAFLTAVFLLGPASGLTVRAAEDPQVQSQARYEMPIESNAWEGWPDGPQVYAESAIVMEASTGTILYQKNIDAKQYPASITKIMTALLALENSEMDEEVTFSHNAVFSIDYGSSSIARDEGEILTMEECLYALMLESANECANAIAEHISGSVEAFAELMNQRAAELGCTGTHFVNPHGLPDDNHYTTAHDMALITQEAIKYERFRQFSGTKTYILRATNKKPEQLWMSNHHYMISSNKTSRYLDETVFAGKTGYTNAALNTLVTCATRNGMDLIVVTMHTQGTGETGVPVFTDTANLLNYGGEDFQKVNVSQHETNFTITQNELFDTGTNFFGNTSPMIEIDPDDCIILPTGSDFSDASPKLELNDEKGSDIIATLSYTYAGQSVGSARLLMRKNMLQEFAFQNPNTADNAEGQRSQGKTKLIEINLYVIGLIVVVLVTLTVIVILTRLVLREFHIPFPAPRFFRKKRPKHSSYIDISLTQHKKRKWWRP